jgi:hypothetical protein
LAIPGSPTTPEEAILLLSKFRDEGTEVLCAVRSFGLELRLFGKVAVVEDGEFEIVSPPDCNSGIRLTTRAEGLEFAYRQPGEFSALANLPVEQREAMALVIKFPDRGLMSVPEFAMVIEAIRGKSR